MTKIIEDWKYAELVEKAAAYDRAVQQEPPIGWREALYALRDSTENFGTTSSYAAQVAIEGCIQALDELLVAPGAEHIVEPTEKVNARLLEAAKAVVEKAKLIGVLADSVSVMNALEAAVEEAEGKK